MPTTIAAAGLTSTEKMASIHRSSELSPAFATKKILTGVPRKTKQPSQVIDKYALRFNAYRDEEGYGLGQHAAISRSQEFFDGFYPSLRQQKRRQKQERLEQPKPKYAHYNVIARLQQSVPVDTITKPPMQNLTLSRPRFVQ